jgi:aminocarboxymuconate-semialdehyde decarboxylase
VGAGGGAELAARLRLMDRAGVDMQVLSACPQSPYAEDAAKAVAAARFVNGQYAGLAERYGDRFRAFAALPMPHIDASVAEMRRALGELRVLPADRRLPPHLDGRRARRRTRSRSCS